LALLPVLTQLAQVSAWMGKPSMQLVSFPFQHVEAQFPTQGVPAHSAIGCAESVHPAQPLAARPQATGQSISGTHASELGASVVYSHRSSVLPLQRPWPDEHGDVQLATERTMSRRSTRSSCPSLHF
jgi:hypothetical protein